MSTKHSIAAARFIANRKQEAWHDETLWMVVPKRDKMSHSLPEWERLRELACDIKTLLQQPFGYTAGRV